LGDSRREVPREAKAPMLDFCGMSFKDDKALTKYIFYVIDQIMSLTGKYIGAGIGYPTRPSQSKGTSLGPGGRELGGRINLSHSEGAGSGILMTWFKHATPSTRRVGLTGDCTGTTTSSILG